MIPPPQLPLVFRSPHSTLSKNFGPFRPLWIAYKATVFGLGFRFAILGMLEFIDWGGGDILHHASRYMADATGQDRFEAPEIIGRNMAEGRLGLRSGSGFMDYEGMDVPAYQRERLSAFVGMLKHMGMLPEAK